MTGGIGDDRYYVDNASDTLHESVSDGILDLSHASINYALGAGVYVERLCANAGATGPTWTGNELVNALFRSSGNDMLIGCARADTLTGIPVLSAGDFNIVA